MPSIQPSLSSSSSPALLPPPKVLLSYGPMLIGVFINMILYGILVAQAYYYYQMYKKDAAWIKYLVCYLLIVETVNTGIDMVMIYQPLILHYGDQLINFPSMFAAEPITIVAVSTPIQLFFAWRIKLLTKRNVVATIVVILSLISFAGGLWTTVMITTVKLFKRKPELHWPALVWFLSACMGDVIITISLVLNLSRRKTGFSATDDAISKIIRMTVQTGMLTALFAIGDVVFFMTLGQTALNFIWDLALTKLYTNCLVSTLNARANMKEPTNHSINQRQVSTVGGGNRRPTTLGDQPLTPSHNQPSMLELDQSRSCEGSSPRYSKQSELEYGIVVTKVVETIQDSSPAQSMGLAL